MRPLPQPSNPFIQLKALEDLERYFKITLKMRIYRPSTGKKFEMMHLDSELTSASSLFKGIFTNFYSKILREATPPSPLTKKPLYVYVLLLTGITIHTFKV